MIGALFIPTFYLHHLTYLFNIVQSHLKLLRTMYGINIIGGLISFHPLYISTVMPIAGFPYWPVAGPLYTPFLVVFFATVCYGMYLIAHHLREASGVQRNQLRYVMLGTLIGWGGGATNFPLWYGVKILPFGNVLVSGYIVCVAYAIIKHRLMDISVIIRKTLVYTAVMAILTSIYLVVVALFARIFQGLTGYQTVFSSAAAAALITLGFQPLRKRVQTFVDRKFFRQYVDREEKLYELSREVITHTTPEAMGGALMHVLDDTLHPKGGALFLRSREGGGFTRVSSLGSSALPERMEEENELARYFKDHPQPFIQDMADDIGQSLSTRLKADREAAA